MQDHAYIGRQPILDTKQRIIAYELLFRHSALAQDAVIEDDLKSCARVLVNTMSDIGANWLLGDKLAFINVSEEMLQSEFLELLPPQRTVLEVLETVKHSEAVIARLKELRSHGFHIALDDFVPTADTIPLLQCAHYIKLDIQAHGLENTAKVFAKLKSLPLKIIAEKVETHEEYEACKKLGFHYFQGYYFAHPETLSAKVINPSYASVLDLLNIVSKDADVKDIEDGFKRDPALSFKLLRYINSVGFGLSCEIQSIRHALTILGSKQLYRWLTLLLVTAGESATSPALMKTAITRGRLTELLGADFFDKADRDNLFIVGVFSLLDAMLAMPMDQVLEKVLLPETVNDALLRREGIYGPFLQLAEACEGANTERIEELAASLQYDPAKVNSCHIAALAWVENLGV
jgi:EAL and modified HD-GYP domain-containing signal transduction protein